MFSNIIVVFTPPWGNDPIWRAYFPDELKPPTIRLNQMCLSMFSALCVGTFSDFVSSVDFYYRRGSIYLYLSKNRFHMLMLQIPRLPHIEKVHWRRHMYTHTIITRWWQLKYCFIFTTIWGRWTHFDEHIFQRGWFNHQLDNLLSSIYIIYLYYIILLRYCTRTYNPTDLFLFRAWCLKHCSDPSKSYGSLWILGSLTNIKR